MAVEHINQVELSRRWRLSPRTLERWRYSGTGPRYPQGWRTRRLPARDIEAFEADQVRATGTAKAAHRRPSPCDWCGRERGDLAAPAPDPAAPAHGDRTLRLDRAGRAGRRDRIPPGLPCARPHRLRPFRRRRRLGPRSACSPTAPTISPSAGSSTSSSSGTGPRTTAISPSPARAAKARFPISQPRPSPRRPHDERPANRPQLGDIRTMPIGEIAALPAPLLALLQEEAEEASRPPATLPTG